MAKYADGFVIVVAKNNVAAYKKVATKASKVWMDHGALSYFETVLEDNNEKYGKSFMKLAGAKDGETVIFAWITYPSKSKRDKANKAVMADPRMLKMMKEHCVLDMKRFSHGGFDVIVEK